MANTPLRNIRVAEDLWETMKRITVARETNVSDVLRRTMIAYVKRHAADDPGPKPARKR